MSLKDVYHVPYLKKHLVLVSKITYTGKFILFSPDDVKIFEKLRFVDANLVATGKRKNSLYILFVIEAYIPKTSKNTSPSVWHAQLGHIGYQYVLGVNMNNHIGFLFRDQ